MPSVTDAFDLTLYPKKTKQIPHSSSTPVATTQQTVSTAVYHYEHYARPRRFPSQAEKGRQKAQVRPTQQYVYPSHDAQNYTDQAQTNPRAET